MKKALITLGITALLAGCGGSPQEAPGPTETTQDTTENISDTTRVIAMMGLGQDQWQKDGPDRCVAYPGAYEGFNETQVQLLDQAGTIIAVTDSKQAFIGENNSCVKTAHFEIELDSGITFISFKMGNYTSDAFAFEPVDGILTAGWHIE